MNETKNNYTFSTLNFWRKAYLALLWLANIPLSGYLVLACFTGQSDLTLGYLVVPIAITAVIIWTHIAVVNRKLSQLKWLAFLNIIPFANIIGALIMLSIVRVTKKELATKNA